MTPKEFFALERELGLNAWTSDGPLRVYLRKTYRFIEGQKVPTNEIGSVEVKAKYRRQGHFKRILKYIESLKEIVYVESVLNKELAAYLIHRGYKQREEYPGCYWKDPGDNRERIVNG